MSDMETLEAQIAALIRAGFSQVESNRQLASLVEQSSQTCREATRKVGQLCDKLEDYIAHNDRRWRESEGKIRVLDTGHTMLKSQYERLDARVKSLEEAEARRFAAGARRPE